MDRSCAGLRSSIGGGNGRRVLLVTELPLAGEDVFDGVGDAAFGGGSVALIAGPCAVEDEEHLAEIDAMGRKAARGASPPT